MLLAKTKTVGDFPKYYETTQDMIWFLLSVS